MKKCSILAIIFASSMALTACGGGDSSSSGTNSTTPANPTPATPAPSANPAPINNTNACAVNGSTVYASTGGCTYSNPAINGGAAITYTCSGGRVSSSIGMSATNIILNGVTITCKP